MPPSFSEQDPLDLEIDRFLSSLPPRTMPAPAADPLDLEIDSFLSRIGSTAPSTLQQPVTIDVARTKAPAPLTIDVDRTLGKRPPQLPAAAILQPPAAPEPTFAQKLAAAPGEAARAGLTSFARMQTEPATAAASMVYPGMAPTFQAVREFEQQSPNLPTAETGELAWSDPRWWAQMGGQALGSAAGLAVAGRVGGAAGMSALGKAGLASVPEALAEAGSTFNDVLSQTGDQRQAFAKASDVFGANMALLGLTNTPLFSEGGKLLRRTLTGAAIEGSQEVGQQAIGNVATGRPVLEGAGEAAVAGALAGGGFRAVEGRPRPPAAQPPLARTPPAATFPPPLAQRPPESPQAPAAPAVDPVDQQIDAFMASLPPRETTSAPPETIAAPAETTPHSPETIAAPSDAPPVDTLATGEQQPRLPGAEQVRDEERPTPTVAAPKAARRNPELTGEDAAVQERAARALEEDWDGFRQRYLEKFGNEISADNTSELFHEYAASKDSRARLMRAVRAPAASLVEDLYAQQLQEPTPEGKDGIVIFTGGGNGSGKSSALAAKETAGADIVFDSTMSEFDATRKKIDAALDSGRFVELRYVYRDPVMAFERGVLPRAKKIGRTVPIPTHVATHIGSLKTVQQLAAHYATEPGVGLKVFEVKEGASPTARFTLEPTTLDALAAKEYPDPSALRTQLQAALARADVSAAIRAGTDLSPRVAGAADSERAGGFAPSRGDLGSGAGGGRGQQQPGSPGEPGRAGPAARGGLPETLGESRAASSRPRFPIPLKSEFARSTPPPDALFDVPSDLFLAQNDYVVKGSQEAAKVVADRFAQHPGRRAWLDAIRSHYGGDIATVWRVGDIAPGRLQSYSATAAAARAFSRYHGNQEPRSYRVGIEDIAFPGSGSDQEFVITSRGDAKPRVPIKLRADLDEGLGSPTRRIFEQEEPSLPATAKAPKTPTSESQAVAQLQRIFGHEQPRSKVLGIPLREKPRVPLPTKTGRFRARAFGIYKIEPQVIRLKRFGDLATFTHELGHHIDFALFEQADRPGGFLFAGELERLGQATSPKGATQAVRMAEGVAEFFRLYFPNPDQARAAAPQFATALDEVLAANPTMARQFREAQTVVQSYLAQDPATRGAARVSSEGRAPDPDTRSKGDRLYDAAIDRFGPIQRASALVEQLTEQPLAYRDSPYILARLAEGAEGKARAFLLDGVVLDDDRRLSGGLRQALEGIGQDEEAALGSYLVARHVLEVKASAKPTETGMTRREAEAIVAKHQSARFDAAAKHIAAYQNGMLDYLIDAGVLPQAKADEWRALWQAYVPLHRVMDDATSLGAGKRGQFADLPLPIKKRVGSGRDIINPIESIVKNTVAFVRMAEQNRVMQALGRLAEVKGAGMLVEKVPAPMQRQLVHLASIQRAIEDALDDAGVTLPTGLKLDGIATTFVPMNFSVGQREITRVLMNGQPQWFSINEPTLAAALKAFGPAGQSLIVKALNPAVRVLRAGVTLDPSFAARNVVRDATSAYIQSEYGFKPGLDTIRGLTSVLKKDANYYAFLRSGAGGATFAAQDREDVQRFLKSDVFQKDGVIQTPMGFLRALPDAVKALRQAKDWKGRAGAVGQGVDDTVLRPLRALSSAMEEATRVGEFKRARRAEGSSPEALARAGLAARDVTVDFARGGSVAREANQAVAFLNARIQGKYRLYETFKRHFGRTVTRVAMASIAPALLAAAARAYLDRDDEWADMIDGLRQTYWMLPGPNGTWIRWPKAFDVDDLVGTPAEAVFDAAFRQDRTLLGEMFHGGAEQVARELVTYLPTAVVPALEVFVFNYSAFRGRDIVPEFKKDLDPKLQTSRWTSETATTIGAWIGASPDRLDYLWFGHTGGLGRLATRASDAALQTARRFADLPIKPKPSRGVEDIPVASVFVRRGGTGTQSRSVRDVYQLQKQMDGMRQSIKQFAGKGQREDVERVRRLYDGNGGEARYRALTKAREQLSDAWKDVDRVFDATEEQLTGEEKGRLLDYLEEQMANAARRAMGRREIKPPVDETEARRLMSKLRKK